MGVLNMNKKSTSNFVKKIPPMDLHKVSIMATLKYFTVAKRKVHFPS